MTQPLSPSQSQAAPPRGPVFSVDVEAVATGPGHNDRSVAQISLVNQTENILVNVFVKQTVPVVSYLTPLTGLTEHMLETFGMELEDAIGVLRSNLPTNATIVGQNIRKDIEWLGLVEGKDYGSLIDLAGLYRIWNPKYKSLSVFGQDHVAKVLLGWESADGGGAHDAVKDAVKSIRLFNLYNTIQATPGAWEQASQALLASPPAPSFARENPTFEGVCMGNRKTCTCGNAFFS